MSGPQGTAPRLIIHKRGRRVKQWTRRKRGARLRAMKWALVLLLLAALPLTTACVSAPPVPDMVRLPGQTLASPEATIEYFRAALADPGEQAVRHQYLCLSEALKADVERKNGRALTLEIYMQVRDDVQEFIREKLGGDVAGAEIGSVNTDRPGLATVELELRGRKALLQLVEETSFSVWWTDPLLGRSDGTLPFGSEPAELSTKELLLHLPITAPEPGAQIYRVSYEKAWRILGLENSDFATDLEEFMRRRAHTDSAVPRAKRS